MKISKVFVLIVALAAAFSSFAQNGFNVPFSQYGIGESNLPYNMPFAGSMGGVVYTRSGNNFINPFNPASYAAIEKESFVFDMGLSIDMCTLKDRNASLYDADGNIAYLTAGMPITRWWKTAFGILPMSSVSYESTHLQQDTNTYGDMKTIYEGTGGVTRVFWGHAFNVTRNLSVGFNANFLYGNIQRCITYDFQGSDTTYWMDSRKQKTTYIHNFTLDAGLQYRQPLGEKHALTLGLTVVPHHTMNVTDNSLIYTYISANETFRDSIFPAWGENSEYTSTLEQPLTIGAGLSLERTNGWLLAADLTYTQGGRMKYTEGNISGSSSVVDNSALIYGDTYRLNVGGEWKGDLGAAKYWNRIAWRCGAHYEQGKLLLDLSSSLGQSGTTTLNEWGAGFGATLPMRKGRSLLNISFGYTSFGDMDLLRRDCFTISLSVSSCESWFVKRKYN